MGNGDGEMEENTVTRKAMGLGFHDGCEWKRYATQASSKRFHRVGLLWSVTCPAFGFTYLFSLPAPIGFQLNGEPQWGGYSNTLKSFYRGPYVRAFLHEPEPCFCDFFFKERPLPHFCVSADNCSKLYRLIYVLLIHRRCESCALHWSHCRFMFSRATVFLL